MILSYAELMVSCVSWLIVALASFFTDTYMGAMERRLHLDSTSRGTAMALTA
jgi:hypothetical protein